MAVTVLKFDCMSALPAAGSVASLKPPCPVAEPWQLALVQPLPAALSRIGSIFVWKVAKSNGLALTGGGVLLAAASLAPLMKVSSACGIGSFLSTMSGCFGLPPVTLT
jgi:hypothetical protein